MIETTGGLPRCVRTNMGTGIKMTPATLAAATTPNTRAVLLCSPSSSTGATCSAAELAGLAEVLARHPDVWVVSDDLYEHILFDGCSFSTIAQVAPRFALAR